MDKDTKKLELELAALLRDFMVEMGNKNAAQRIALRADFEADLGIDSLGRVEYLHRAEKAFQAHLTTRNFSEIHTLEELINVLKKTLPMEEINKTKIKSQSSENPEIVKNQSETIIERFLKHVEKDPNRIHIYYQDENGQETPLTYEEIYTAASKVAHGLVKKGLNRYDTVAILLPTSKEFFAAFLGTLLAGGIPTAIYPPFRLDRIEEYIQHQAAILENAEARILITFKRAQTLSKIIKGFVPTLKHVVTAKELMENDDSIQRYKTSGSDPALIQYTSGSTGTPKGVLLSHGNIIANINAISKAVNIKPDDTIVSWLPLYHDMGLIGTWLSSLYFGFPITIMSPLSFLTRPEKWLWAIHSHRATFSCAPNFAYELCATQIEDKDIEGLDLSSLRVTANGAETVFPETIRKFIERFKPYGFKPSALLPAYGLAENTVALTIPPLGRKEPRIDIVKREDLETKGKAIKASSKEKEVIEFASCGHPIPKHEIKIVDDKGRTLPDRTVGRLWFRGPSVMQGYFNNPVETEKVMHGEWLDSSDYAYIAEGDVFITGRRKDIIIKAGRNIYPQDLEEITSKVKGIQKRGVIAFGIVDEKQKTEKIIVVAETNEKDPKEKNKIANQVTQSIVGELGIPPDQVLLVPPRTIPKTSSGKLQRSACKALYLSGKLSKKAAPFWVQMLKVIGISSLWRAKILTQKMIDVLYTLYIFLLAIIILVPGIPIIMAMPKKIAQKIAKFCARLLYLGAGHPLRVQNKKYLTQKGPVIYVSNHTSYSDAILHTAILPAGTAIIGKAELFHFKPFRALLLKLGHFLVNRSDIVKDLSNLKHMAEHLKAGKSLMIFPEGTFTQIPGLLPFKSGAFKLAVENNIPIVPVTLRGTRKFLPDSSYLLHPTKIEVIASKPIKPKGKGWKEITRLKNEARAAIAENCGETSFIE